MKAQLLLAATLAAGVLHAGRPVARWDVIPYQRVSSVFTAGVVAVHEKPVTVEFTVNGKKVHAASAPELNARTQVKEYVFAFDAAKYPDGPVTLGAKALVEGEEPYALPDITLYANAKKSQGARKAVWADAKNGNEFADGSAANPVSSIKQGLQRCGDGGVVFLQPGTYSAKMLGGGKERKFWTIILPAKGVTRDQVKILGGRTGTDKLRFVNCELYCDVNDGYGTVIMGEGGQTMAWFDNCRLYNRQGRYTGETTPFGNRLRAFVTGGVTEDLYNGPNGEIVRNHEVRSIANIAFANTDCLVANTKVADCAALDSSTTPSLFRGFVAGGGWSENVIFYGVSAADFKGKSLSGKRVRDTAFVDVKVEGEDSATAPYFEKSENVTLHL